MTPEKVFRSTVTNETRNPATYKQEIVSTSLVDIQGWEADRLLIWRQQVAAAVLSGEELPEQPTFKRRTFAITV